MLYLENDNLKLTIDPKGAELKSVFHKQYQLEYMWGADPTFWAKTSPVLFPIVGQLKDNSFRYKDRVYHLSRHGFAREKVFALEEQTANTLRLSLRSNEESLTLYPFSFLFSLLYTLQGDELTVSYQVQNTGEDEMLFSVGGHPAFRVPLVEGTAYDDYNLRFNEEETAGRWPISKDGQIETQPEPLLEKSNVLPLSKNLFQKDAIVLKHLRSTEVQLASDKTPHGLQFGFEGFPFLGLWAAPGADFLCIEPWCGIADSVNADGELAHKEGINRLAPGGLFSVEWKAAFY